MKVSLPTSWEHVTVATYAAIQGRQGEELLAALLGITLEEAYSIEESQLDIIWQTISFLNVPIPYQPHKLVNAPVIALEPIGKFERAKEFLLKYPFWDCCPNVYALFYGPGLSEFDTFDEWTREADQYALNAVDHMPITKVYNEFKFIDEEINRLLKRYEHIFKSEYTDLQIAAGIKNLEKYGFMLTLHQKCDGKPWEYEKALRVATDTFYMTLAMEAELNKYREEEANLRKQIPV